MRSRKFPEPRAPRQPVERKEEVAPSPAQRARATASGPRAQKWNPEMVPVIVGLYGRGWTNTEIAELIEVPPNLLRKWRQLKPELKAEMDKAQHQWRAHADDRVVRALYERAIGYSFESEIIKVINDQVVRVRTVEHFPPDVKAAEIWLTNRRGGEWRQKQEVVYSSGDDPRMLTDEELLQIIQQGQPKQIESTVVPPRKAGNGTTH